MLHPHTHLQLINEQIGYGVVATRLIPQGAITWVRDNFDRTFAAARVDSMTASDRAVVAKYCFVDARGDFVLCGRYEQMAREEG